jgi:hypothetical protein
VKENSLKLPAFYRLAFRELGLSIGLRAIERIQELVEQKSEVLRKKDSVHSLLKILGRYARLKDIIEEFWLEGTNREAGSWIGHLDINRVMLATSLAPNGFLEL